jgi:hypothetical protein
MANKPPLTDCYIEPFGRGQWYVMRMRRGARIVGPFASEEDARRWISNLDPAIADQHAVLFDPLNRAVEREEFLARKADSLLSDVLAEKGKQ